MTAASNKILTRRSSNCSRISCQSGFCSSAGSSEKCDKVHAHRQERKQIKDHITSTHGDLELLEEIMMPKADEISDPWTSSKDGKSYIDPIIRDDDAEFMKKVKTKIMRK